MGVVGASVRRDAVQSIPNAALTAVSWDVEEVDDDDFYAAGQPTRLTVPTDGWYIITFYFDWATNGTGYRQGTVRINGVTSENTVNSPDNNRDDDDKRQNLPVILWLTTGDYIELMVWQNSGGGLNLTGRGDIVRAQGDLAMGAGSGATLRRAANQSVNNASDTLISFDTEDSDTDNYWAIGVPTKIYAPEDGWYVVYSHINWQNNVLGTRYIAIKKNGAWYIFQSMDATPRAGYVVNNICAVIYLLSGDYVEINVWQNSIGSLNVTARLGIVHVRN